MKKYILIIALGLGGFTWASAQTATATSSSTAPKAACCQKGGEAKACCAKDAKTASATTSSCSGHAHHDAQKADATAPAPAARTEQKTAKKTSSK